MRARLEQYFEFEALRASWKTEIVAGLTTFATMAYIIFVNPAILHDAGMPIAAVTAATCLCTGAATIAMGIVARYPLALAPGMGLNAYFAYSVVKGMGISWQTALAAVFFSGVLFLVLTAAGLRQKIIEAIPPNLYAGVAAGIGLFLSLIGLKNSGIVLPSAETIVKLGNLHAPSSLLAIFGLTLTSVLLVWRVPAAMILGIAEPTVLALATGQTGWRPAHAGIADLRQTAFHLDFQSLLGLGLLEVIFTFTFVDLFDNLGTLVAVSRRAGIIDGHTQDSARRPNSCRRRLRYDGRRAPRHFHCDQLCRERSRHCSGRTHRGHCRRDRAAVSAFIFSPASGGNHSCSPRRRQCSFLLGC